MELQTYLDEVRTTQGLLTIAQVIDLASRDNVIYDPVSVLISRHARIGSGNIIFPGVFLFCTSGAGLEIGNGNRFHANTLIDASAGLIGIGSGNQFGEGGFTARADRDGSAITIGDRGRYVNGCSVFGRTQLGSGSQLIGAISVSDCILEEGGDYREPDPDKRAGLLKGSGVARGLTVPAGHVIAGAGAFNSAEIQPQRNFHPRG